MFNNLSQILLDATSETTTSNKGFSFTQEDWEALGKKLIEWGSTTGVRFVVGLIALFILIKITNFIARRVRKNMTKHGADKTITSVVYQVISTGFKILWFIIFLGFIGVQTASIGSIIASIGVAIGLAVQGSLANFAGGLVILVTRPFKVGDYIKAQSVEGTVEDIRAFYTHLVTVDNKVVLVPNGALSGGVIVNVSAKDTRRVDEVFSIAYDADYDKAVKVITKVINKSDLILKDKDIFVRMSEHAASSINITTRVWVNSEDYWTVHFYLLEEVKRALDSNNIEIPYDKLDVNIKNEADEAVKKTTSKKSSKSSK